jgi:hypothetical protein
MLFRFIVRVPVCGGIILSPTMDKVLMVKGFGSKIWTFPKGRNIDCRKITQS